MDAQPQVSPPPIEQRNGQPFFQKHKLSTICLFILILALIPLIILTQINKKSSNTVTGQIVPSTDLSPTPSPTVVPLTPQTATQTLQTTDQNIQTALDQSQTQIDTATQSNTSDDSTSGL